VSSRLWTALIVVLGLACLVGLAASKPKAGPRYVATVPKPPPPTPEELHDPVRIGETLRAEKLEPRFEALKPLHEALAPPRPGEWLAEQEEDGQSFEQYRVSEPVHPTADARTLYLLPIGAFTPSERRVLDQTADFLARFFQLPVKTLDALPESEIPVTAKRKNPYDNHPQVLSGWVMRKVLIPRRPYDAVAVLGLTATDLYPAPSWNFVFGEASLSDRVGVWSMNRNGDPDRERALFLARTLKTAAHELGHMFGLQHCLAYRCLLNGSNSLEESDRQALELCPACLQKLAWNVGFEPKKRFLELIAFDRAAGLEDDAALLERSLAAYEAAADAGR
jgi:archaemetzincin